MVNKEKNHAEEAVQNDKKPGKHTAEVKQKQTNEHTWYGDDLLPKDWPWQLWNGCSDATSSTWWVGTQFDHRKSKL